MKPASSEYIPGGQAAERPRSTALPWRISMMTTGSVRGKCCGAAGRAGAPPAGVGDLARARRSGRRSGGWRASRGCPWRPPRCRRRRPASSAITARRSPKASVAGRLGWRVAALVDEGPRAGGGRGAVPVRDRRGRSAARRRRRRGRSAGSLASREDRGGHRQPAEPGRRAGVDQRLARQSARQSARGSARAPRAPRRRRAGAPRGRALPRAKVTASASRMASLPAPGRDHAARPRRRQSARGRSGLNAARRGDISARERLVRAGAPPTRSGPEGSSRNGSRLGRFPASHLLPFAHASFRRSKVRQRHRR